MNTEEFATKILKISSQHWYYVLRGERNLGTRKAEIAANILGTESIIWMNPDKKTERKEAWAKFKN